MVKLQFIIVADRGSVKAYRVEETAIRAAWLQTAVGFNHERGVINFYTKV